MCTCQYATVQVFVCESSNLCDRGTVEEVQHQKLSNFKVLVPPVVPYGVRYAVTEYMYCTCTKLYGWVIRRVVAQGLKIAGTVVESRGSATLVPGRYVSGALSDSYGILPCKITFRNAASLRLRGHCPSKLTYGSAVADLNGPAARPGTRDSVSGPSHRPGPGVKFATDLFLLSGVRTVFSRRFYQFLGGRCVIPWKKKDK